MARPRERVPSPADDEAKRGTTIAADLNQRRAAHNQQAIIQGQAIPYTAMAMLAAASNALIDQAMAAALAVLSATATLANVVGTMASSTAMTTTRDARTTPSTSTNTTRLES